MPCGLAQAGRWDTLQPAKNSDKCGRRPMRRGSGGVARGRKSSKRGGHSKAKGAKKAAPAAGRWTIAAKARGAAASREKAGFSGRVRSGARTMKPAVLIVGADKGGVGKTTITRTLLDYLARKNTTVRAFDAEYPRGTLKRFHPAVAEIVNLVSTADQMRMLDTLTTSGERVSVIDVRAGLLSPTLIALKDIGFFDAVKNDEYTFSMFHILGPSVASLEEIGEVLPYMKDSSYFAVKNFINEASFFEWDRSVYDNYFRQAKDAIEVNIPKLNEMACEQVELAGVPFSAFIRNKNAQGQNADYSLVLRGYVRTWLGRVSDEYERIGLLEQLLNGPGR
jgi:hypothetical protein